MRHKMEYQGRFLTPPAQSFFLLGPRGTGKSTWLLQRFPDALVIDLLDERVFREINARPERLEHLVAAAADLKVVVIDEVQRVPAVLNVVHALIERGSEKQYVLTGSSARKLRRGGVDLLAGRALHRTMHPFMAAELATFDLSSALQVGLLPVVVAAPEPLDVLDAYATLYLEQEVQLEGWARSVSAFARFLEAISFSHASVLNIANVARECQIERKTVAAYIDVLEDLLLSFRLSVFSRRARRQTTVHPKLYLFDAGVYRSLRPRGPLDRPEEIEGAAFEGLVAQHLRTWVAYSAGDHALYFWRTRSGVEVDFVVYGSTGFWAIEVKSTATIRPQDLRGLRAFRDDYPECRPVLVYRGTDRLEIDGILCVPGETFLRSLEPSHAIVAGPSRRSTES